MPGTLTRWDPSNEIATMRSMMDRLFDRPFGRVPAMLRGGEDLGPSGLNVDVYETPESFVVKAAVPGMDPKDVDISVEDDILTIKGEHEQKQDVQEDNYLRRELRWGSFQRSLRLPPTVDAEKADAKFENGVLSLTLPKKPEAQARSIKIVPHA